MAMGWHRARQNHSNTFRSSGQYPLFPEPEKPSHWIDARPIEAGRAAGSVLQEPPRVAEHRGGAPECPVKLDKQDELIPYEWSLVIRDYGNGLAEAGWSLRRPRLEKESLQDEESVQRIISVKDPVKDQEAIEKRAVARAKTMVRRKVMGCNLSHLLTLTYRENFQNFEESKKHVEEFIFRVRKKLKDWPFVGAVERQKRGAIHWHLGVRGFQKVRMLREIWLDIVGDLGGTINVRYFGKHNKSVRWGRLKLGYYLAKYIGKSMGDFAFHEGPISHRYKVSRDDEDCVQVIRIPCKRNPVEWAKEIFQASNFRVAQVWDEKVFFGWLCSWTKADAGAWGSG